MSTSKDDFDDVDDNIVGEVKPLSVQNVVIHFRVDGGGEGKDSRYSNGLGRLQGPRYDCDGRLAFRDREAFPRHLAEWVRPPPAKRKRVTTGWTSCRRQRAGKTNRDGGGEIGGGGGGGGRATNTRGRNFYVVQSKDEGLSFTIFAGTGDIVATGINRFGLVNYAVEVFCDLTGVPRAQIKEDSVRVTNSTFSGQLCLDSSDGGGGGGGEGRQQEQPPASICQTLLEHQERLKSTLSISLRSQFFPGIRIKYFGVAGSITLFNNGKINLVGVRSEKEAGDLKDKLCASIRECLTTTGQGTRCASSADSSWRRGCSRLSSAAAAAAAVPASFAPGAPPPPPPPRPDGAAS